VQGPFKNMTEDPPGSSLRYQPISKITGTTEFPVQDEELVQ